MAKKQHNKPNITSVKVSSVSPIKTGIINDLLQNAGVNQILEKMN